LRLRLESLESQRSSLARRFGILAPGEALPFVAAIVAAVLDFWRAW
jgi:hypothetical protein